MRQVMDDIWTEGTDRVAAIFAELFWRITCLDAKRGNPFVIYDRKTGKSVGGGFTIPRYRPLLTPAPARS